MNEATIKKPNKLINEKSPYLLQHAYNPVNWYPWQEEAFNRAQKENKPIFLSIGYSTCHWCHVMEHESFEDNEVAKLMNDCLISIKVDREERPDIDNVYMTVCQMMTGSGGWPLTIFMTPDKKPFLAGTYFPKYSRYGRVGMMDLLPRIKEIWISRKNEILDSANQIVHVLNQASNNLPGEKLDYSIIRHAGEELKHRFDKQHGGFGDMPKFPTPHNLLFLLRFWKCTKDKEVLEMVEKTLQKMCLGGIYDHIGFGFHRYSTDAEWLVPHFEKMLYDQAMLAMAYTEAYQVTKNIEYENTAREIFTYVLRDMTSPNGGFYSAEDADSEGQEGKFYVWTYDEIKKNLEKDESDLIIQIFNIEKDGNANIFHLKKSLREISLQLGIPEEDLKSSLENAKQKLFQLREKRIHPHKDDKILTSWNGLMIAAFSKAAQVFNESSYIDTANRATNFILTNMQKDGKLLHCFRDGEAKVQAYLDDYAFLIWGLLELYETTFETKFLKFAIELNNDLQKHFWDKKNGGYYFTADYSENVLIRQKEIYDGAIPSSNAVSMLNLLRLSRITGDSSLEESALKLQCAFSNEIRQAPLAHTQLLNALDFSLGPTYEVIVIGNSQSKETVSMLKAIKKEFLPNKVLLFIPSDQDCSDILSISNFAKLYKSIDGKTTVYVCQNYSCKEPTTDINKMLELLGV